jgi:hypothetical protein
MAQTNGEQALQATQTSNVAPRKQTWGNELDNHSTSKTTNVKQDTKLASFPVFKVKKALLEQARFSRPGMSFESLKTSQLCGIAHKSL